MNSTNNIITPRAVVIGLVLVVLNAYWIGIASELWGYLFTLVHPCSNAIFTLVLLIVFNYTCRKFSKKIPLSAAELLIIYIMVTMVSTISGHTMMDYLVGALSHPFWHASPENEWQRLFWQYIPQWFSVSDKEILKGYFYGESTFHTVKHLKAWAIPILMWSAFIFFLYTSLLCISSVLRKQWDEKEKLSYPIVQLPIAMATDRKFFNSRLMWAGFAVSASVRIINGFHDLFPLLPEIPSGFRIDQFLTEKPWNAIGYTLIFFNLSVVGLTYFMPLDLVFSCWFFFWLTKTERVFASMAGTKSLYLDERAGGAWMGIGLIALWVSRRHLISFAKHVFGLDRTDDSIEPLRYKPATFLFFISFAFLAMFCYLAGMSLWTVIIFFVLYYLIAIAIARVRAELGPPYHEVIGINLTPRGMMVKMFGSRRLRGENLAVMTHFHAFNRCNRAHPMASQVESLKIGARVNASNRRLIQAMMLAIGVGAVAAFLAYLQAAYTHGAQGRGVGYHFGQECFRPLQNWLQYPQGMDAGSVTSMAGGFLFVCFLYAMRTRFLWWPLHPSGYVLSGASWGGMVYFWFPTMVGWLIKSLIITYGGLKVYRKCIPFFFGLILGDHIPRSLFSILGMVLNVHMPSVGFFG